MFWLKLSQKSSKNNQIDKKLELELSNLLPAVGTCVRELPEARKTQGKKTDPNGSTETTKYGPNPSST